MYFMFNRKTSYQICAILSVTILLINGGIQLAWTSQAIPIMISPEYEINVTLQQASYLTLLSPIASIIFGLPITKLMDLIGRKRVLLLTAIPQIISWILIYYGGSIYIFYAARAINGISDAICFSAIAIYVAEVSTPQVRKTCGSILAVTLFFGNLLSNVIGSYCSIRMAAGICLCFPILFLVIFKFMPETPYYYLMKNKEKEARNSLYWLRREDVEEELQKLKEDVARQMSESGRLKDMFCIKSNRNAMIAAIVLRGTQHFNGFIAFLSYSQLVFQEANVNLSPTTNTLIFSGFICLSFIITGKFLKMRRRKSLTVSTIGITIVLFLLNSYFYLDSKFTIIPVYMRWLPLFGMLIFVVFYSIGAGSLPTIMMGELFSTSIKSYGIFIANVFNGIFMAVATQMFHLLFSNFGLFSTFLFFSVCTFITFVCCYYFVPETSGKTLEEIQQDFKTGSRS